MADEPIESAQPTQEEPAAPAGKKKGKLPVVIVLAVLLGFGGFFGVKMRAPKVKKEPEIKLGEVMKLNEFLVNLSDGTTYLRIEIALHFKEGIKVGGEGEEGGGGSEKIIIQDAIINILTSKSSTDLRTTDGKARLRHDIATAVNHALEAAEEAKAEGKPKPPEGEKGKDKEKDGPPKHPDWDSETGPVLKVYFTSFATQ